MDKNTATGLILMSLLLIIYFQFFSPQVDEPAQTQPEQEQIDESLPIPAQIQPEQNLSAISDSAVSQENKFKYGIFSNGGTGESNITTIENEDGIFSFNSKGGVISRVHLKDFLTYYKKPLILIDENSSKYSLTLTGATNSVNLNELYYKTSKTKRADTTYLTFTLDLEDGRQVKQIYAIPSSGFQIGYRIELKGLDAFLQTDAIYRWENRMKNLEHDVEDSRIRAAVNYYTLADGFDGFSERSTDLEEESLASTSWISFKQHFFTSAIIAKNKFSSGLLSMAVDESDTSTVKIGIVTMKVPADDFKSGAASFTYYLGPNNYQVLKKVTKGFDKNVYMGWPPVNIVNKYLIIPIFNFLEKYISNYGIIIIILVIIIKLLLSPLSYKSYLSMAKTKVLKPELDELKSKYPDDMQKQQKEQMKLYQQVGVNPLSGCIPMVLQMPILFAMFYFFPGSIELRQESFLWADDLSTYDSVLNLPFTIPLYGDHVSLFVLLMTASTILYTWSNNQVSAVQGPMKSMSYMMPFIFMFVLNSFPAALSFYYFVANLVTFAQQALIRKFVDEDKILAILNENRLRNKDKKKSKFQLKLEQAMKASEASGKKKGKK